MTSRTQACEHPRMGHPTGPDAGQCLDCDEKCSCVDDEQPWASAPDCPIHGAG